MSLTPREIGTLVVVILKAQHLPNKQRIGKQDPYCCVTLNGEKRRTRAIKRGGQHPEWDEEVRFTLYEDTEDILARSAKENAAVNGTPPPLPSKEKRKKKVKGGNSMLLACFADDPKEPELIGETVVDLSEVLTKGETDDWFVLNNKEKFSGEVYLELTFWSNERPPEKKKRPRVSMPNYGGPGSFIASDSENSFGAMDSRTSLPESLQTNSSLGRLDLYTPAYGMAVRPQGSMERLADEFGGLNVNHSRRRESYPPPRTGHTPRPTDATYSSLDSLISRKSGSPSRSSSPSTPVPRSNPRQSFGEHRQSFPVYQSPYESTSSSSGFSNSTSQTSQNTVRPDYVSSMYSTMSAPAGFASIPSASSGFQSLHTPTTSSFQNHPIPPQTHTAFAYSQPASAIFPPPPLPSGPSGFAHQQNQTPPASGFVPPPSSMGYHQPQQTYSGYQQYPMPPASAPPTAFPTGTSSIVPNPPHSAPPQQYPNGPSSQPSSGAHLAGYAPTTPPQVHQQMHQAPHQYNPSQPVQTSSQGYNPSPLTQNTGSRPLPQPIVQSNGNYAPVTPPPPSAHSVFSGHSSQGPSPPHTSSGYSQSPSHSQIPVPGQASSQQQGSHPLPVPPGPPSQTPMTIGPPPASNSQFNLPQQNPPQHHQQNAFSSVPPPPSLRRVSMPPGSLPQPENRQESRGNSPVRPPLPQPPPNSSSISAPGVPFPGRPGSSFNVPPPPPLLNKRAVSVSMSMPSTTPNPMNSLPQPPSQSKMNNQQAQAQRLGVQPGEIYSYGAPPPRPPQMMYEDNTNGHGWHSYQAQ